MLSCPPGFDFHAIAAVLQRFDIVPAGDLAVRQAVTWLAGRPGLAVG